MKKDNSPMWYDHMTDAGRVSGIFFAGLAVGMLLMTILLIIEKHFFPGWWIVYVVFVLFCLFMFWAAISFHVSEASEKKAIQLRIEKCERLKRLYDEGEEE